MNGIVRTAAAFALIIGMFASAGAFAANILVFGGTRGVGLETVRILIERGDSVTAFVRPTSNRADLEPLGVVFAVGDALDADSVMAVFAGKNFDAVISSLGAARGEGNDVDSIGTTNLANAAKAEGVSRFVMVSAVGVGNSKDAVPANVYKILEPGLVSKKVGEDYLMASGLDATVVRPGGLGNGPATNDFHLTESPSGPFDRVDRAEVARLTVQALDEGSTIGKRYHVAK